MTKTIRKKTEEDSSSTSRVTSYRKPLLLLHICCGPCSAHVIDLLKDTYHPIGFFYNPNLYPREEYSRRLEAAALVSRRSSTALWVPPFDQESWSELVRGLEQEPEGGRRCDVCIRQRLDVTARMARTASLDGFATTLTVGPRKNSRLINDLGSDLSHLYHIPFLEADFKKKDGYLKSVQKSKELGLYRQDYCGCCFSMRGSGDRRLSSAD